MIPPFVIPKRSPFLISGVSWELHDVLAATCFHHLGRHFPAPHVLPPQHPSYLPAPCSLPLLLLAPLAEAVFFQLSPCSLFNLKATEKHLEPD